MDPWGQSNTVTEKTQFEDDFKPENTNCPDKLADSAQYLALLEKRLAAVRSKNNIVENLSAYRADCIERLLREGCHLEPVQDCDKQQLIEKQE